MKKQSARDIVAVEIRRYLDSEQVIAYVKWGHGGTTSGATANAHMQELIARTRREGVRVRRTTAGSVWS